MNVPHTDASHMNVPYTDVPHMNVPHTDASPTDPPHMNVPYTGVPPMDVPHLDLPEGPGERRDRSRSGRTRATAFPGAPSEALGAQLAASRADRVIYDLTGIEHQYDALLAELPGTDVRFALKACPVDDVLRCLADRGAGFDAASPAEIAQALRTGVSADRVHYGNTVKSDHDIAEAHRLGVRTFATDSVEDVAAIAAHAPGARVFCRLATSGEGALWGLSRKFGCAPADAVRVLATARAAGLVPAGLSVHVGSQQMTGEAWQRALDSLAETLVALDGLGITPDHVNLGGGLPARGYLDRHGDPLDPPLDKMFAVIREGMERLTALTAAPLGLVMEPGRHLVADHGAVRAHVYRLTERVQPDGTRARWLYLSAGKFNGLYEMDQLRHRLVFPGHEDEAGEAYVPAVVAGPTCDSDDAYGGGRHPARVPRAVASGDPVWILSAGAYATSYTTQGFNGIRPLPCVCTRAPEGHH
ncbi:type III PLP-dependent enzyme [Streptomyces sp. SID161]|uniref:type III PLP-dependent enzyme n=1 Tax=Streptomyces sp. SID161 TaxID=2690251 RepID=UPI001F462457|nr:type III PLP-dependent enzyme [Streptomyces sp. SID161]